MKCDNKRLVKNSRAKEQNIYVVLKSNYQSSVNDPMRCTYVMTAFLKDPKVLRQRVACISQTPKFVFMIPTCGKAKVNSALERKSCWKRDLEEECKGGAREQRVKEQKARRKKMKKS